MIVRNYTYATPQFCRSPWKHDLLLLSLCHFPSSLDGQVSQPPLHRRWRSSMLHGGQLPSSTASQGPPGPRILQISPSFLSDPLTLFVLFFNFLFFLFFGLFVYRSPQCLNHGLEGYFSILSFFGLFVCLFTGHHSALTAVFKTNWKESGIILWL